MNKQKYRWIVKFAKEAILELEENLLDLQTKIVKELEYSDMPMGSGGKKSSYQEKLLEKREVIIEKLKRYNRIVS